MHSQRRTGTHIGKLDHTVNNPSCKVEPTACLLSSEKARAFAPAISIAAAAATIKPTILLTPSPDFSNTSQPPCATFCQRPPKDRAPGPQLHPVNRIPPVTALSQTSGPHVEISSHTNYAALHRGLKETSYPGTCHGPTQLSLTGGPSSGAIL